MNPLIDDEAVSHVVERVVMVHAGDVALGADLVLPASVTGLVLVITASAHPREGARVRLIAQRLHAGGFGTLAFNLLSGEDKNHPPRKNSNCSLDRLGRRVERALDWACAFRGLPNMPIGLFGVAGAAAPVLAGAANRTKVVRAVVTHGGQPNLAGAALGRVQAPTLLVVNGADMDVVRAGRSALVALHHRSRLDVVPGRPGTTRAAELARDWLAEHLGATTSVRSM
jgi:putative phosphoribosyl transferase